MTIKGTIARGKARSRRKQREKSDAEIRRLKLAQNKAQKEAREAERLAKARAELEKAKARLAKAKKKLGGRQRGDGVSKAIVTAGKATVSAVKKVDKVLSDLAGVKPGPGLRRKKSRR